jgi:hypothetical protein
MGLKPLRRSKLVGQLCARLKLEARVVNLSKNPIAQGLRRNLSFFVWLNGTFGQKETAPKGGTLGERCTAALEGQPDEVSALVEPRTRILAL